MAQQCNNKPGRDNQGNRRKQTDRPGRKSCCDALSDCLSPGLFRALCDPRRLEILCALSSSERPRTVGDVAACCPVDMSVVSRHLSVLREAGVVTAERRGRRVHYTVNASALASSLRSIADALETCCGAHAPGEPPAMSPSKP